MAFLSSYFAEGVLTPNESSFTHPQLDAEALAPLLRKLAEDLAKKTLLDSHFKCHRRSDIASAIILAARQSLGITPLWSPHLTELTGCTSTDAFDLSRVILQRERIEAASSEAMELLDRGVSTISIQSPSNAIKTSKSLGVSPTSIAECDA